MKIDSLGVDKLLWVQDFYMDLSCMGLAYFAIPSYGWYAVLR